MKVEFKSLLKLKEALKGLYPLGEEMKKSILKLVILSVMVLILVKCGETEVLRLASWNIRIFSNASRDDAELHKICQVLIDYDFIAIVELRDEAVLKRAVAMLNSMGRDYDYQISSEVGRRVKERYAFLYDRSKVKVLESGRIFPDPDDVFIREPYYATFRAGKFDFTSIVIHVIWGDTVAERRAEIRKLDDVYRKIQASDPLEQDVILLGDFNLEPNDEGFNELNSIPSMVYLFKLPQKSHIKDSSLYDNIWFQSKYLSEFTGICGIDRFDEELFGNNDKLASLAVSDHRPIWAEFSTDFDDDGIPGYISSGILMEMWGKLKIGALWSLK